MALGTRSYGNSLLVQNIFNAENHPDTDSVIKAFCRKVLNPIIPIVEENCGTTIGRVVQIPESDPVGLINLEDETIITEDDIVQKLIDGETIMRLRDSSACVSVGGSCSLCARGYNARHGSVILPPIGDTITGDTNEVAYLNYIANTFSGSMMGYLPLASEPLPQKSRDWSNVTNHTEMDSICRRLARLNVPSDEMGYLYSIEDVLERALYIIGTYGVYGNV